MAEKRVSILLPSLVIGLMVLFAYIPVIQQGGYVWDDDQFVFEHLPGWMDLKNVWTIGGTQQYYPATFTTFWLERYLWGQNPRGYHVVNILLHIFNSILLWVVLRKLKIKGSWIAAAIFAVHPVHVESVAWISERKNVLSGFFYFLSILAYFRFSNIDNAKKNDTDYKEYRFYLLSIICFVFALLAKTVTVTLPAVLFLLIWYQKGSIQKKDIAYLIPLFILGLQLALGTVFHEKELVGAKGSDWDFNLIERCLIAGRVVWFYIGKLIYPGTLIFSYPRWTINVGELWQFWFPFFAILVPVVLWLFRKEFGRGPLVAYLFFVGTLFPALGFFNVYPMRFSFVADHFQYLASVGPIVLFSSIISEKTHLSIFDGKSDDPYSLKEIVVFVLLAALMIKTYPQGKIYRNENTLWLDTIAKNPKAWIGHVNLGYNYSFEGNDEAAIKHYYDALKIKPDHAKVYANLGVIYVEQKKYDKAIEITEHGLRLDPKNEGLLVNQGVIYEKKGDQKKGLEIFLKAHEIYPESTGVHLNLGYAYRNLNEVDKAIHHFKKVLEKDPNAVDLYYEIYNLLEKNGRKEEALAMQYEALEKMPDHPSVLNRTGNVLYNWGRVAEGTLVFAKVAEMMPQNAHVFLKLGAGLRMQGETKKAYEYLRRGLEVDPKNDQILFELGSVFGMEGKKDKAVIAYKKAIELNPKNPSYYNNLAAILGEQGKIDEAMATVKKAIEIDPKFAEAYVNLGYAYREKGDLNNAAKSFQKALELSPRNPQAAQALATLQRAAQPEKVVLGEEDGWKIVVVKDKNN